MTSAAPAHLVRRILDAPWQRRFWAELCWIVVGAPLVVVCLLPVLVGLAVGIASSILFVGLMIITGTMLAARRFGGVHRSLAVKLLDVRVDAPSPPRLRPGLWNWIKTRAGDPVGWRAVAYLLLRLVIAIVSLGVVGQLLLYAVFALTYPILWFFFDGQELPVYGIHAAHWVATIPFGLAGVVVFFAVPWVAHALTSVDRLLVRGLLGPTTLSERVRDLELSRATAVEDATVKLRSIERDLHDGAQAQLVALAMKLGIAKDELDADALDRDRVRTLVSDAHANAKQALVELRDLARGIHPAALDAGLDVALSTLVSRVGAPARLHVDLPERPPPAIETILYFSAAELLTNAVKHTSTPVHLEVATQAGTLRLMVSDSGNGGARLTPGGGLAGLVDRLRTVDGRLDLRSPGGGPTVITVEIPLPRR
jgi:signal transduction histidine kinase